MNKSFKDALEKGLIMPALLLDGSPFVVDDVVFYQATEDGFNLSIGRFHAFGDVLRRHDELKLTGDLLDSAMDQLESLFRRCRAQINLDTEQVMDAASEGIVTIERLRQRRSLGLSVEQVYEIASIFYFHENEDPGSIDTAMNRKKIDTWLKWERAPELWSFFLAMPISNYMPLSSLLDKNILNYLMELGREEIMDLTAHLLKSKMSGQNPATTNSIESRRATLFEYDGLLTNVLSRTTTSVPPGNEPS